MNPGGSSGDDDGDDNFDKSSKVHQTRPKWGLKIKWKEKHKYY